MGSTKEMNRGEFLARETLGKSLVWARSMTSGETVTLPDMGAMSPGHGLEPYKAFSFIGKAVRRDVQEGCPVVLQDFAAKMVVPTEKEIA